jgi:DNA-binding NarL/FixJ family response regulator
VKNILQHDPDTAVLDMGLQSPVSFEVATILKARNRTTSFVMLAHEPDEILFDRAIRLGIRGYVLKRNPVNEILECIAAVASGGSYVSASLTDFVLRRRARLESLARRQPELKQLTTTERRVLGQIADGKTSREIAAEFHISPRTVDSHRAHIREKLGLTGNNCLLFFALEHRDCFVDLA